MSVLPLTVSQAQTPARADVTTTTAVAKTAQINLPVPSRGGSGPADKASSPTRNQPTGPLAAPEANGGVLDPLPSRASVETVVVALSERQEDGAREDRARQDAERGYHDQAKAIASDPGPATGDGTSPVGMDLEA